MTPTPDPTGPANEGNNMSTDPYQLSGHRVLPNGSLETITLTLGTIPGPAPTPADSIVIPRADLPFVEEVGGHFKVDGLAMPGTESASEHRRAARRLLALAEYLDAQEPRPLAVGDRVRVVEASGVFAVGDVGSVAYPFDDGDIRFRRDGAVTDYYVPAANFERIEDDRPHVGHPTHLHATEEKNR